MREDHEESLDKMFPEGWLCLYTCPDGFVRLSLYNPKKSALLDKFCRLIEENSEV